VKDKLRHGIEALRPEKGLCFNNSPVRKKKTRHQETRQKREVKQLRIKSKPKKKKRKVREKGPIQEQISSGRSRGKRGEVSPSFRKQQRDKKRKQAIILRKQKTNRNRG